MKRNFISRRYRFVTSTKDNFFKAWATSWTQNKDKILTLSLINLSLTFFSELLVRGTLASLFSSDLALLVSSEGVSTQGIINCLYTFLISLLGVPLLFFKGMKSRYICFLFFGLAVSFIAQLISYKLISGVFTYRLDRFLFDLGYLSTLKFISFELFRPALIGNDRFKSLFTIRFSQDFIQTIIKTVCLLMIGLNN